MESFVTNPSCSVLLSYLSFVSFLSALPCFTLQVTLPPHSSNLISLPPFLLHPLVPSASFATLTSCCYYSPHDKTYSVPCFISLHQESQLIMPHHSPSQLHYTSSHPSSSPPSQVTLPHYITASHSSLSSSSSSILQPSIHHSTHSCIGPLIHSFIHFNIHPKTSYFIS